MQALFPGKFGTRTDVIHFNTVKYATKLLSRKARGDVSRAQIALDLLGINNSPSFLWRSPLIPSHMMIPLCDKLHQRQRGFTERAELFVTKVLFSSESYIQALDFYLLVLKRNGFPGLVTDNRLFSSKNISGNDRRNLEEALPYICYILDDEPLAMEFCDLIVLHLRMCEQQDRLFHTESSLDRLAQLERDFKAAARNFLDCLTEEGKKIFGYFKFPKHLNNLEYSAAFRLFGDLRLADTGHREQSNKPLKEGWLLNNKIKAQFQQQLVLLAERKSALSRFAPLPKSKEDSILQGLLPILKPTRPGSSQVSMFLNIAVPKAPMFTFNAVYLRNHKLSIIVPADFIALRPEFAHLGFLMQTASPGFWNKIGSTGKILRLHMYRKFYFSETIHRVKGTVRAGA